MTKNLNTTTSRGLIHLSHILWCQQSFMREKCVRRRNSVSIRCSHSSTAQTQNKALCDNLLKKLVVIVVLGCLIWRRGQLQTNQQTNRPRYKTIMTIECDNFWGNHPDMDTWYMSKTRFWGEALKNSGRTCVLVIWAHAQICYFSFSISNQRSIHFPSFVEVPSSEESTGVGKGHRVLLMQKEASSFSNIVTSFRTRRPLRCRTVK